MRWNHRDYIGVFGRYYEEETNANSGLTVLFDSPTEHVTHAAIIRHKGYAA